jgi:hypothetical protein
LVVRVIDESGTYQDISQGVLKCVSCFGKMKAQDSMEDVKGMCKL